MKAEDIVVLDMRNQVNFCDYFVIVSGNSDRQVRAVAQHLQEEMNKAGTKLKISSGMQKSNWIVLDVGDVVTHIFHKDTRAFYNLEGLWQDSKEVKWS